MWIKKKKNSREMSAKISNICGDSQSTAGHRQRLSPPSSAPTEINNSSKFFLGFISKLTLLEMDFFHVCVVFFLSRILKNFK